MSHEVAPITDRYKFLGTYYEADFVTPRRDWHEVEVPTARWRTYPYSHGEARKLIAVRISPLGAIDSFELNLDNPSEAELVTTDNRESFWTELDSMYAQVDMGLTAPNEDDLALLDELIEALQLETEIG